MQSPIAKDDIVRLVPDLVLLQTGQMSWDRVGLLLNEDLQAVKHLQFVEHDGRRISAVDNPWQTIKEEMQLFASSEDPAYDPLRQEIRLNHEAGPAYMLLLFNAWLSLKTGFPTHLLRTMTGAVLWGLAEQDPSFGMSGRPVA